MCANLFIETFFRRVISYFSQAWLIAGFPPSQSIILYPLSFKFDFTPYQSMKPVLVYTECMPKYVYCSFLTGSTNVYYSPLRTSLQIQFPLFGKWPPWRRISNSMCHTVPVGRNITIRPNCEISNILMLKPGPYFRFPPPVIVLNARLKTPLSRWSKDRDDSQSQTQSHHSTDRILVMMRSLKSRIIIKLSILWQSYFLPMFGQRHYSRLCAYSLHRPRYRKPSVKRNTIEHIDMSAPLNNQIFHHIKTIKLGKLIHYIRQIPTSCWCRSTYTCFPVQCTTSFKDAAYGARTWGIFDALTFQFTINSLRTVFTKIADFAQFLSNSQYFIFYSFRRTVDLFRDWRSIIPINSIQSLPCCSFYPVLNGRKMIAIFLRYLPLRCSMSYFTNHCSAQTGHIIF